jgi:hypothetical protein
MKLTLRERKTEMGTGAVKEQEMDLVYLNKKERER